MIRFPDDAGLAGAAASTATAGHALASFLLGYPASGSVTPSPAVANQTKYYAGYVQDSFKVTGKLTLNLGLRWEMETPRTDRFNQLTNFDYDAKVPLNVPSLNLKGGLTYVGVGGLPRTNTKFDANNFAPRFGFAYQVAPKTVLRGGAAGGGAVENHILHALAAQLFGRSFAQHPAHGIDHVGFAAAVGTDHGHQLAGHVNGGGVGERFETGKFDGGEAHDAR